MPLDLLRGLAPPRPPPITDDARALASVARGFVMSRVLAANGALERGDRPALRALLEEAGPLGLLGVDLPPSYGGLGASPETSLAIAEALGIHASFAVSVAAHTTIGTLPIARFGSVSQRAALPARALGATIGAYALTEPGAGSDAFALRTTARRDGGDFVLSGAKQFVTNAGIADEAIVFAQLGDAGPTAFVVPLRSKGVVVGAEERKLGLHGSSTCSLTFDGARVAASALLGEEGRGHRIALDVLGAGRAKLGALALGHARFLVAVAARYAAERHQFGRAIGTFGLVRAQLGEVAARAFALEAVVRRAARALGGTGDPLAVACVAKLLGARTVERAADVAVQVHGGYGYLRGGWAEQSYRDARINRIYEGTDEMNQRAIVAAAVRAVRRRELAIARDGEAHPVVVSARRAIDAWARARAAAADDEPRDEVEGALADLLVAAVATLELSAVDTNGDAALARRVALDRLADDAASASHVVACALGDSSIATARVVAGDPLADRVALGARVVDHGGDPLAWWTLGAIVAPGTESR